MALSCTFGLNVLQLAGIQKRFGGVVALSSGDLDVRAGEVHLLLGENGAGKSTMMKIVAGMQPADAGEVVWKGQRVAFRNPAEAQRAGIAMVHQESLLAPHLTVAENIWLGREPSNALGLVNRKRILAETRLLLADHNFPLQADWRVERLSPAGKQLVEICRAVAHKSSLLIFDEPTSSLSDSETREVFRIVRTLKERGLAIIYITHRMEELRKLGDRATVLRDGKTVFTGDMSAVSTDELIRHMVGREVSAIYTREPLPPGPTRLKVSGLSRKGVLHDVSFELHAGEIVGLGGLIGSGRTELCRALFGVDTIDAGKIEVDGKTVSFHSPRDAVRAGLALVPEDRQRTGLAVGRPVGENMMLASLERVCRFGFVQHGEARQIISNQTERFRLKADSAAQRAGKLSGGNQQKVVISKWVVRGAQVVIFDEPTRGIDIGAKVEVFQVMEEMARNGAAILMVSSELPELLQVADRILVMRQGRIVAELPGGATQEEILRHAALDAAPTAPEGIQ